jgi:hypothetical protein
MAEYCPFRVGNVAIGNPKKGSSMSEGVSFVPAQQRLGGAAAN